MLMIAALVTFYGWLATLVVGAILHIVVKDVPAEITQLMLLLCAGMVALRVCLPAILEGVTVDTAPAKPKRVRKAQDIPDDSRPNAPKLRNQPGYYTTISGYDAKLPEVHAPAGVLVQHSLFGDAQPVASDKPQWVIDKEHQLGKTFVLTADPQYGDVWAPAS